MLNLKNKNLARSLPSIRPTNLPGLNQSIPLFQFQYDEKSFYSFLHIIKLYLLTTRKVDKLLYINTIIRKENN